MKTKIAPWLFILLFVMSCLQVGNQPTVTPEPQKIQPTSLVEILPTATSACISLKPTQADIDRALAFTGRIFEKEDWERSYTVTEERVTVSWLSNSLASVAFLQVLIFPCGYEEPDLNQYFNDETWDIIFSNYESYEHAAECRNDAGLRLYEFDVISNGAPYLAHYWARNDTDTRVITFMMFVPADSFELLDSYGYSLFPQLSNCS